MRGLSPKWDYKPNIEYHSRNKTTLTKTDTNNLNCHFINI